MKLIIQRVTHASVSVKDSQVGAIGPGFMVLVGLTHKDNQQTADTLAKKLLNLRIMADSNDKFNLSILDTKGELLIVPQFTLYANLKGNRPSFTDAMEPKQAKKLFDYFLDQLKESGLKVESGTFGAYMQVSLTNDGPVTIVLESTP